MSLAAALTKHRKAQRNTYSELIRSEAAGTLSDTGVARLAALVDQLGIDDGQADTDVELIREMTRLEVEIAAGDPDGAERRFKSAAEALAALRKKISTREAEIIAEHRKRKRNDGTDNSSGAALEACGEERNRWQRQVENYEKACTDAAGARERIRDLQFKLATAKASAAHLLGA
jgi:hypothetical protein